MDKEACNVKPTFLIGYMASGKSTLAGMLSAVHGIPVVDTDERLEQQYGMSCGEMIRTLGMDEFRRREQQLLCELSVDEGCVVATGGGMPCFEKNLELMKGKGKTLYLRWSPEMLVMRLFLTDLSKRPLIYGKSRDEALRFVREQLQEREKYYMQADYVLECDELSDYGIYENFLAYDNRRD